MTLEAQKALLVTKGNLRRAGVGMTKDVENRKGGEIEREILQRRYEEGNSHRESE